MKRTKLIMNYLIAAFVALVAGALLVSMGQMVQPDLPAGTVLPLLSLALFAGTVFRLHRAPGVTQAIGGIDVEFWTTVLMDVLFPKNSFMMRSVDHGDHVLGGVVVHVPNAGAVPALVRNRSTYPATAAQRTDVDLTYPLVEYTTDPTHITEKEKTTIAYDKVASVLRTHSAVITKAIADDLHYNWSAGAAAQILRTTGANGVNNLSPGATGTRKIITTGDLSRAMTAMNLQDVPEEGRVCLLPSQMYEELLNDPDLKKRDVAKEGDYANGSLARLYGFDIMQRRAAAVFSDAASRVR
ncbi:MAG: hypothetical protein JST98_08835, partial [Bacteroidetes bacterium]|nr:hypothetical protein [Bacteroidota bacterium]